jgi:hypothetical protein
MNQQNEAERNAGSRDDKAGGLSAKSHAAAEQLKESLVGQVDQVRDRAESAKEQAAERIRRVATQLRQMSETLHEDDNIAASVAERASRSIEGVAQYVSKTDAQGFVRDTEQLARRQPALFFGGAFLLGLAAGRFLKSSSPDQGSYARSYDRLPQRSEAGGERNPGQRWSSGSGSEASEDNPNERRYRENYAAAFGRDTGESEGSTPTVPRPGTSATSNVSKATQRGFDPNKAPESNGSRQAGKGTA